MAGAKKKTTSKPPQSSDEVTRDFSMHELFLSLHGNNDAMMESEKQIAEYLERCGFIPEAKITSEEKARANQKMRKENYHNVQSLLGRYRTLRRTYRLFKENFADKVIVENQIDVGDIANERDLFEFLCKKLDLLSAKEENRFQSIYAPYIITGRKIETALEAVDAALESSLKGESEKLYSLIKTTYIDGDEKPSVQQIMATLNYDSVSNYYRNKRAAEEKLAFLIFGYSNNRAELFSILAYLRQQAEADGFPDET